MTTSRWQRLGFGAEEGGGMSPLGKSLEFWKMPILPPGCWQLQKSPQSPTVSGKEQETRGGTGEISSKVGLAESEREEPGT